jgi:hypothetical protein
MAKSYKKFPGCSDGDRSKKFSKRQAARKVRHYKRWLPNGSKFKTLYERWDICDYNFRMYSWKEAYDHAVKWLDVPWRFQRNPNYSPQEEVDREFWRYVRK